MKKNFQLFIVQILVLCFAGPMSGQINQTVKSKLDLSDIYAPVFVATPPENAFNGLVQLPDGTLRHYGFRGPYFNHSGYYYIFSKDNGLTWDEKGIELPPDMITNEEMPPPAPSPYSGHWLRIGEGRDGIYVLRGEKGPDSLYQKKKMIKLNFRMKNIGFTRSASFGKSDDNFRPRLAL